MVFGRFMLQVIWMNLDPAGTHWIGMVRPGDARGSLKSDRPSGVMTSSEVYRCITVMFYNKISTTESLFSKTGFCVKLRLCRVCVGV